MSVGAGEVWSGVGTPSGGWCAAVAARRTLSQKGSDPALAEEEHTQMMSNILNDLHLYQRLISMQLRAQAQYKINLAIDIGTYLSVTGLEFVSLLIYLGPFHSLLGWSLGEVALLYAVTAISFGLAELFGAGIDAFPETIRRGEFD